MTTTRKYYPDFDLNDNGENIYNLQKYKNGYTGNTYDNRISNRYPLKSNLKKDNHDSYRSKNIDSYGLKNGYKTNLTVNGNTFRNDSGYHSSRFNTDARNLDGTDLETRQVRDVSCKTVNDGLIHEDTLIDVIDDLQVRRKDDEIETRPGILQSRYEKTQRTIR